MQTQEQAQALLNNLVSNVVSLPSTGSKRTSQPSEQPAEKAQEPLSLGLLEKLWITMTQTYGHKWTSSFGEVPKADHAWAKILGGLNGKQIANGLHRMIELGQADPEVAKWPPSAPDFRAMCLHVVGFPPIQQAWTEALMGKYSHEAVEVAAKATGTFDLRSAKHSDKALRQRFERNYAIVQRRAQNAQPLDGKITQGIEHDSGMKAQLARSHQEARDLVTAQNIPTDGQAARKLLLAKLGIRRPA